MVYKRVTTRTLLEMKSNNEKISMLTAYDYTFAKIIDKSNVDVILVGDSASNVIAGNETTGPSTLCLVYTSPSRRDATRSRMPSSA